MNDFQAGLLEPIPALGRYLFFSLAEAGEARAGLSALRGAETLDNGRVMPASYSCAGSNGTAGVGRQ